MSPRYMHRHARYKIKVLMRSRRSCPPAPDDDSVLVADSESTSNELANAAGHLAEPMLTADRLRGGARKP
jgi:hypothetical protein